MISQSASLGKTHQVFKSYTTAAQQFSKIPTNRPIAMFQADTYRLTTLQKTLI